MKSRMPFARMRDKFPSAIFQELPALSRTTSGWWTFIPRLCSRGNCPRLSSLGMKVVKSSFKPAINFVV